MEKIKLRVSQFGGRVGIFIERYGVKTEFFADYCEITLDEEVDDPFKLDNAVTITRLSHDQNKNRIDSA
jgi:hypothetical protein